ncbi:MAG: exodeoxyribonuclease VII large subunit [Candidatus Izimaplasma sp.]|nr:exodeoxyribonuclease VII large subunit [Candidatus Izimaplasma bacterium]
MVEQTFLTVTALTKYIKYKFDHDKHLKHIYLKGEISNFKHHSRGHFYFTLKDDKAQISAIMFASHSSKITFKPIDGMSVEIEGYVSVYPASGQYQIYVNKMNEAGKGDLYIAYEKLKKDLQDKGLFEQSHKQPIPRFPKSIAVLTSPTGAAVRDIIHIVNRRYPVANIIVYPTLVQGEYAKDSIVKQIKKANKDGLVDVIILGRGGGSIEDLWPFNEETVAYAIYESTLPIISSVGHETDFTISDFVADLRAPTPSGGAEIAVPNQVELLQHIEQLRAKSHHSIQTLLKQKQERLERVATSVLFRDPLRLIETQTRQLAHLDEKLVILSPKMRLKQYRIDLNNYQQRLHERIRNIVDRKGSQYELALNRLELLNPLSIMKKGYSVIEKEGNIIKSVTQLNEKDMIDVKLHDGTVQSEIKAIKRSDK